MGQNAFEGCNQLNTVHWNAQSYTSKYPFVDIKNKVKIFIFGEDVEHISSLFCNDMSNQTSIIWRATHYNGAMPLSKVMKQVINH